MEKRILSVKAAEWFKGRGIPRDIIERMRIYTGSHDGAEVRPNPNGDVIVFPFLDHGRVVNEKYRTKPAPDGSKKIWQKAGGKRTFYNVDALDHPALRNGKPLVIVEGEPDLLAVLTAGYEHVVSVPDGAPPAFDQFGEPLPDVPKSARSIPLDGDDKFQFLRNSWPRLRDIKNIVLFVDGDAPGQRLRDELARRLGRVRCSFVTYPKGTKDANEILVAYGPQAVLLTIEKAAPIPIEFRAPSLFQAPPIVPVYSTGWPALDSGHGAKLLLPTTGFVTLLGRAGDGKSTWVKQLVVQLAKLHRLHASLILFEDEEGDLVRQLAGLYLGKPEVAWSDDERVQVDQWLKQYVSYLIPNDLECDEDTDIEWLIDRMQEGIGRYGTNVFVIDPWNEIEHRRRREESYTEYTGRAIRALKRFAKLNRVLLIVIVHPSKDGALEADRMSLYHADGSAHWVNKPDIGLILMREEETNQALLKIRKLRFAKFGKLGDRKFSFDPDVGAFY